MNFKRQRYAFLSTKLNAFIMQKVYFHIYYAKFKIIEVDFVIKTDLK
jgi:hypothetical protein